jgi:hypothetical protein
VARARNGDEVLFFGWRGIVEIAAVLDRNDEILLAVDDQRRQVNAGDFREVAEAVAVFARMGQTDAAEALDQRKGMGEAALDDQAGDASGLAGGLRAGWRAAISRTAALPSERPIR